VAGERLSDSTLIRSCLRGDASAWDVLVERYARLVYAVPSVLGCAPALSGEVALAVWRSLLEHLPTLEQRASLGAWLVEAARDACAQADAAASTEPSAFGPIAERLLRQHEVRQGVATLSRDCQRLLATLYGSPAGELLGEVARRLKLSEEQATSRRATCLRRLLGVLAELHQEATGAVDAETAQNSCGVPFEQLVAYAEGTLRGDALEQLAVHLRDGCSSCRQDLLRLEQLLGLMHTDRSAPVPDDLLDALRALFRTAQAEQPRQWAPLSQGAAPARHAWGWLVGVLVVAVLAVGLALAYAYWPVRRSGRVMEIVQGSLRVKLGQGAPWTTAREGQIIGQGARLEGSADAIAVVRFWNDSLLRIESDGEWAIRRLQGSHNRRLVRQTIYQAGGQASYASMPPTWSSPASLRIELDGVTLELVGTATVAVLADGTVEARVYQGSAQAEVGGETVTVETGQQVQVLPGQSPVVSAVSGE